MEWNAFVSREVVRYLEDFRHIEIVVRGTDGDEVRVLVHPPYMMQTTTLLDDEEALEKLAARHRDRLARVLHARENAPDAVRALLRRHFDGEDGSEKPVACGRAPMEDIRRLLQEAMDRHLVAAGAGKPYPDRADLRQWLKTYGIGVDCSAFVQHALTHLVRACYAEADAASDLNRSYEVGRMLSRGIYREINATADAASRFAPVTAPGAARPGDVLVKRGHVRIVAVVEAAENGGVILALAESTAAKGIPAELSDVDTDIGPRLIRVKYPEPGCAIDAQIPLRQRWYDGAFTPDEEECVYILGRLKALSQICTGAPSS